MRPAKTEAFDVADGWAALRVLEREIAQDDPRELRMMFRQRKLSPPEIHAFVKSRVRYVQGVVQRWATPKRTLEAGFGDCGNSSRAIMTIARLFGYPSRLRVFVRDYKGRGILGGMQTAPAHVAAQIWDGERWAWCEAAIDAHYGEPTLAAAKRLHVPTTIREVPIGAGGRGLAKARLMPMPTRAGCWPWRRRYPQEVTIGRVRFRRTRWAWPKAGVVAQYREAVPIGSMHLYVWRNGAWSVDHRDGVNPDQGSVVGHFLADVVAGVAGVRGAIAGTETQVAATKTPVSVADMWQVMAAGWAAQTGFMPSTEQLQVIMAQWMLETGNGASMIQWNVGNFKHVAGDGMNYATYQTSECTSGGSNCTPQSGSFVAYDSLAAGVDAYYSAFVTGKWKVAWPAAVAGDVSAFAQALSDAGYYTASESSYESGMNARVTQLQGMNLGGPSLPANCIPNYIAMMGLLGGLTYGAQKLGLVKIPKLDPGRVTWAKLRALHL